MNYTGNYPQTMGMGQGMMGQPMGMGPQQGSSIFGSMGNIFGSSNMPVNPLLLQQQLASVTDPENAEVVSKIAARAKGVEGVLVNNGFTQQQAAQIAVEGAVETTKEDDDDMQRIDPRIRSPGMGMGPQGMGMGLQGARQPVPVGMSRRAMYGQAFGGRRRRRTRRRMQRGGDNHGPYNPYNPLNAASNAAPITGGRRRRRRTHKKRGKRSSRR